MSSLRRTLSTLAAAGLTAGALTAVAPAPAEAAPPSCTERNHRVKYRLSQQVPSIAITQMRVKVFGPGVSESKTVQVGTRKVLHARAKVYGEVNTKIGNKLMGEAEVKAGLELEAMGESTKDQSSTVTERIVNNSRRNIEYVFFRGSQTVSYAISQSYCDIDGQEHFGVVRWKRVGTWESYTFPVEGAPACGRGASNSVTRKALEIGCA